MMKCTYFVSLTALIFSMIGKASSVASPTIVTTSGKLVGVNDGAGVISFKKVPYAHPPTGNLRWTPPAAFISAQTVDASQLGPSCFQQFAFATQSVIIPIFNTPPPLSESEDCLYLNIWAPESIQGPPKAVIFWLYGGILSFGTASLPLYDGTSLAKNQNVVVVSINYRTNVFGFPFGGSNTTEIPLNQRNLGLLDQELALQWVRQNIHAFGGDPNRIALMGHSAGADSVTWFLQRHPTNPPFQSAIMLSSAFLVGTTPTTYEQAWTTFATAVGCTQPAGMQRLQCLKQVPGSKIHDYFNSSTAPPMFAALLDNITVFPNPVDRILDHKTARVPILQGGMQDDGSIFAVGDTDVGAFLNATFGPGVTQAELAPLYPGLSGFQEISQILRDFGFLCSTSIHTNAYIQSGATNVFRYIYGAVFADLQKFPDLGAYHSSELPELFGTFNHTTATASEVQLSSTFQTIIASFAKNPFVSPARAWPRYNPNDTTLAKLAYDGNVALSSIVEVASPAQLDQACTAFWDTILLLPPTGAGLV